jgi:hypothetical protein
MVEKCTNDFPNSEIVCKDVLDTMAFEHNTFSHILCTGFTIYEMEDKDAFFKVCYYWLMPNGYLVLHLADRDKFKSIVPAAEPSAVEPDNSEKYAQARITKSLIQFPGFSYFADYGFPKEDTEVSLVEKFSDSNGRIRKNERTLYMDPIDKILQIAMRRGFIVHSKTDMAKQNGDENQYLYILERAM